MKHYTSIEQSKKLVELGLNRDTADLVYQFNFLTEENDEQPNFVYGSLHDTSLENIPCWSVGALMNLLPDTINGEDLLIYKIKFKEQMMWEVGYGYQNIGNKISKSLISDLFSLFVWLFENGYMEKEK